MVEGSKTQDGSTSHHRRTKESGEPQPLNRSQNKNRPKNKLIDNDEDTDTDDTEDDSQSKVGDDGEATTISQANQLLKQEINVLKDITDVNTAHGKRYDKYLFGKKWLNLALSVWHIFVMLSSGVMVVIAYGMRYHFADYVVFRVQRSAEFTTYSRILAPSAESEDWEPHFHEYVDSLGQFFLIVNSLYIVCMLIYLSFPLHRNSMTLPFTCYTSALLALVEISYVNIVFGTALLDHDDLAEELQEKLHDEYQIQGKGFALAQDFMSAWLQCCGIVDSFDFRNSTLTWSDGVLLQIPPVCCKRELFLDGFTKVSNCSIKPGEHDINENGCMDTFIEWMQNVSHYYCLFAWIHLLDCFMHAFFYRRKINFMKTVLNPTPKE